MSTIAIIATMDTKGKEAVYLRDEINKTDHETILINVGIMEDATVGTPTVTNVDIAKAAGYDLEEVRAQCRSKEYGRVHGMRIMSKGLRETLVNFYESNKIDGTIGIGGAQGMNICTPAMKALPTGVPTLVVSTIASGQNTFGPFVGTKDMVLMHSVCDIVDSSLLRLVLDNAAGAIGGMVDRAADRSSITASTTGDSLIVGATMLGTTTPGVSVAKEFLEQDDIDVVVFHPNGVGGMAMEDLIQEGYFDGILDLTTVELREWVVGGKYASDETRLDAAATTGTPQVVSVGGVDQIQCGPPETLSESYRSRQTHQHNQNTVTVRANEEELRETAQIMAEKLNKSIGPVEVYLPEKGVSSVDREGEALYAPEYNRAMFDELEEYLRDDIPITRLDAHINDPEFGERAASALHEMLFTKS